MSLFNTNPALDAPGDGQPCPMALCNGTVVYLADGTECCSCTIARFEALYGYLPALQHQPETTNASNA